MSPVSLVKVPFSPLLCLMKKYLRSIRPPLKACRLQLVRCPQQRSMPQPPYQPVVLDSDKPHLLVVEDNREMSAFLIRTLSPHYRCTAAWDGQDALDKLGLHQIDLITSDVIMPNMDGFTFREKIATKTAVSQHSFYYAHGAGIGGRQAQWLPSWRR